jgi:hypothetical protein
VLTLAGGKIVQHGHHSTGPKDSFNEVGTYKTCPPGYEYTLAGKIRG